MINMLLKSLKNSKLTSLVSKLESQLKQEKNQLTNLGRFKSKDLKQIF
jgi:hypothetical protein